MARIAVLMSGKGTLLSPIHQRVGVTLAVFDRQCDAQKVAHDLHIPMETVWRNRFPNICKSIERRMQYSTALADKLKDNKIQLVVLAGFMTIVTEEFLSRFPDRVLNIHPSLLPSFKGVNAVQQALDYGVKLTGCTVHKVVAGVDEGPIIDQRAVPVRHGDTELTLRQRIQMCEWVFYPQVIKEYLKELGID